METQYWMNNFFGFSAGPNHRSIEDFQFNIPCIRPLFKIADDGAFFLWGGQVFSFLEQFFFRGRRTGGKSGEILILSLCDFRFLAFCNHWLRCCRSLNRTITPALSLFESLWQAAKSNSDASAMLRWSLASFTQALRVMSSSSLAAPFSPWIVRLHLRLWMSRSRVCRASLVATLSTCCANAGRADFSRSSIRRLVNSMAVSNPSIVVWMFCMVFRVVSMVSRRSPISALIESLVSFRIILRNSSSLMIFCNSLWEIDVISSLISFLSSSHVMSDTLVMLSFFGAALWRLLERNWWHALNPKRNVITALWIVWWS